MPIIYLHRDGEVAEVNTDHAATHKNFLAHGWAHDPATTATESPVEAPEASEATTPADEAIEASTEAPAKPVKAPRKRS